MDVNCKAIVQEIIGSEYFYFTIAKLLWSEDNIILNLVGVD